jgi:flavin reductase (DIM6/NTAB) family NADH-FMN oxidoreductase RutF
MRLTLTATVLTAEVEGAGRLSMPTSRIVEALEDPVTATSLVDADLFRALLRRHAAAVVVVTAPGEPPVGFTATSFTSVSLDPPLVSFCLAHSASSWSAVARAEVVAVHVLTREQEQVARTFATSGIDRFASHRAWQVGPHGVPLLDGALAWLVCRVVQRVPAGDHTIVLAEPVYGQHEVDDAHPPLFYHMGRYGVIR